MSPVKRIRRNLLSSSDDDNLKKLKKERTRKNHSPSTSRTFFSNQQTSVRHVSNMIVSRGGNLWGAKKRRTPVFEVIDDNKDSDSTTTVTRGDSNMVARKVDECLKGNSSLDCNSVSKDCILPSEDANVRAEYTSTTHNETSGILERVQSNCYREETSQNCVGNDKGENFTPKKNITVMDKCSDVTATLVDDDYCNLIERPPCNVVYTRSSKRRRTSNVDQPTSKSTDEKLCAIIMEDSGRPQGNNVEAEKISSQQKSLHLSLKPEIAKLCEILLLPDNVESNETYVSEIINESHKRKNQWRKLLRMQLENKNNLKKYFETKEADLAKWYKIELGAYKKHYAMTKEQLKDYTAEYYKRLADLKSKYEVRLQAFETKKLEARQKYRESWTLDEVLETTSDLREVVHKTTTKNTLSPVTTVSSPMNLIEPQEQVRLQPLSSVESPHSPVIPLPANQSNHVSMVMEPIEKMHQLPSSNQDFSREDAISSQICVASTGFQNQASEKPASNLEVGSRTHRLRPPISNMVIDSHVYGVVRAPSSNTRNNHPIQTAVQSASNNVRPLCNDPIRNQMETIRKHDELKELQLKYNFEKEMKKIGAKFQEEREKTTYLKMMMANAKSNPEFPGASRMLHLQDAGFKKMLHQLPRQQNVTCQSLDSNPSSHGHAAATSQNSYASAGSHTMVLSPALQTCYNTSEIFRDFSARLPISSASRNLQAGEEASYLLPYGPSTFIPASGVSGILHGMSSHSATPSCINSISSVSRNLQAGVEIHTPVPHLYASSTFIPSCVSGVPHGMPSHPTKPSRINSNSLPSENFQAGGEICTPAHIGGGAPYGMPSRPAAPSNSPAGYLSQWLAKPMLPPTAISKVGTHRGHGQENIGLSPHTHTLSFKDMNMNPNRR